MARAVDVYCVRVVASGRRGVRVSPVPPEAVAATCLFKARAVVRQPRWALRASVRRDVHHVVAEVVVRDVRFDYERRGGVRELGAGVRRVAVRVLDSQEAVRHAHYAGNSGVVLPPRAEAAAVEPVVEHHRVSVVAHVWCARPAAIVGVYRCVGVVRQEECFEPRHRVFRVALVFRKEWQGDFGAVRRKLSEEEVAEVGVHFRFVGHVDENLVICEVAFAAHAGVYRLAFEPRGVVEPCGGYRRAVAVEQRSLVCYVKPVPEACGSPQVYAFACGGRRFGCREVEYDDVLGGELVGCAGCAFVISVVRPHFPAYYRAERRVGRHRAVAPVFRSSHAYR